MASCAATMSAWRLMMPAEEPMSAWTALRRSATQVCVLPGSFPAAADPATTAHSCQHTVVHSGRCSCSSSRCVAPQAETPSECGPGCPTADTPSADALQARMLR